MWVHSNPLMSHAVVTFISPPVVTPPPVAKSVSFTGYITMLWVRPLEMCLDPYKNWIQVDPVFEFLKLLLCCDVALSSPTGPSQKLSLAQLLRCDAMRQAIWRTILTFSTAKLYKGSRVAYKFVQVVPNRANIMVTYPNQQDFVASLTSSVNGISRVRIARVRRIACRVASLVASQKSFCESRSRGSIL